MHVEGLGRSAAGSSAMAEPTRREMNRCIYAFSVTACDPRSSRGSRHSLEAVCTVEPLAVQLLVGS